MLGRALAVSASPARSRGWRSLWLPAALVGAGAAADLFDRRLAGRAGGPSWPWSRWVRRALAVRSAAVAVVALVLVSALAIGGVLPERLTRCARPAASDSTCGCRRCRWCAITRCWASASTTSPTSTSRSICAKGAVAEPNLSHPHNWLLHMWLELGLLGLIAFGWLCGHLRRRAPREAPACAGWSPARCGAHGRHAGPRFHRQQLLPGRPGLPVLAGLRSRSPSGPSARIDVHVKALVTGGPALSAPTCPAVCWPTAARSPAWTTSPRACGAISPACSSTPTSSCSSATSSEGRCPTTSPPTATSTWPARPVPTRARRAAIWRCRSKPRWSTRLACSTCSTWPAQRRARPVRLDLRGLRRSARSIRSARTTGATSRRPVRAAATTRPSASAKR